MAHIVRPPAVGVEVGKTNLDGFSPRRSPQRIRLPYVAGSLLKWATWTAKFVGWALPTAFGRRFGLELVGNAHPTRLFVLVSDEAMEEAVRLLLEHTHNIAELAGAASLAAALQLKSRFAGKKIALVLSGGNLAMDKLRRIIS